MPSFGVRGKPSSAEIRQTALVAVRYYLRGMQINPLDVDADGAERALGDFLYKPELRGTYAYAFADEASDQQMRLFRQEWEQWRKENTP